MKKWKSVISVVEVVIMLTCVVILITYYSGTKTSNKKYETEPDIEKNGEIIEDYALDYLNKYVDEILFSGYINEKSEKYIEMPISKLTPNIFGTMTEKDKLYLTLSYLNNKKLELNKENIENKYNEYFNSKDIKYENIKECPSFTYDKENEIYKVNNNCELPISDNIMVYKAKYERDENDGYATIYVGIKSYDGIYKDLTKENIYEESDIQNFKINEENYEAFSKYIINFKEKDDALYYFFSIKPSK